MKIMMSITLSLILIVILLFGVAELPEFGDPHSPVNNYVSERYLDKGLEETGAKNLIAAVILDYRAYDTFGESTVLFTSVICVLVLLKSSGGKA